MTELTELIQISALFCATCVHSSSEVCVHAKLDGGKDGCKDRWMLGGDGQMDG